MTHTPYASPSPEFWEYNQHLLKLDEQDRVYFTKEGKSYYRPLLAKWGYALSNIKTREQFRQVMLQINALELEENTAALREALDDPATTEEERALVRQLLGESNPVPAAAPAESATSKKRTTGKRARRTGVVIEVDFRRAS
jgi:hypothetical protein